jgi:hypothetical protein
MHASPCWVLIDASGPSSSSWLGVHKSAPQQETPAPHGTNRWSKLPPAMATDSANPASPASIPPTSHPKPACCPTQHPGHECSCSDSCIRDRVPQPATSQKPASGPRPQSGRSLLCPCPCTKPARELHKWKAEGPPKEHPLPLCGVPLKTVPALTDSRKTDTCS